MADPTTSVVQTISGAPAATAGDTVTAFNQLNINPTDAFTLAASIPQTIGGIPGIGSSIPGLGNIALPTAKLSKYLAPITEMRLGLGGKFEPVNYATDLNARHPKFKFLFKVLFKGFAAQDFYYFVHRVDRPKIKLNHVDVNYYNFRSRVLTSVTYEPLQMTFLDEIGNSVNAFFTSYMSARSGTANGNFGIERGFGDSTSSKPYLNGYSAGQQIIIEQIFGNGSWSNRFMFMNPRIESFDLDDLNMEDNACSMAGISFSYDAIEMETVPNSRLYGWGQKDLLKGNNNAGDISAISGASLAATGNSATSALVNGVGNNSPIIPQQGITFGQQLAANAVGNTAPAAISDLVPQSNPNSPINPGFTNLAVGSGGDNVSQNTQTTIAVAASNTNMQFDGASSPTTVDQATQAPAYVAQADPHSAVRQAAYQAAWAKNAQTNAQLGTNYPVNAEQTAAKYGPSWVAP